MKRKRMPAQGPEGRASISPSLSAGTVLVRLSMYPKAQPTEAPPACKNTRGDPLTPQHTRDKLPDFRTVRKRVSTGWTRRLKSQQVINKTVQCIISLLASPFSQKRWKEGSARRNRSPVLRGPGRNWRRRRHSSCTSLTALSFQSSVSGNTVREFYFVIQISILLILSAITVDIITYI